MNTATKPAAAFLDALEARARVSETATTNAELKAAYDAATEAARAFIRAALPEGEDRAYLLTKVGVSVVAEKRVAEIAAVAIGRGFRCAG